MTPARTLILAEIAPKVPGLSVAVAVDGKLVWSEAFGYADVAQKILATPQTRFRIGSVSKPLTSVGLALLVERGLLDLDAPIQTYIPDFPHKSAPLTLRLLAGHLSGIRNYQGSEAASNKSYPNLRAGLKIFESDPLIAPPGTRFSYASYNWNVIGVAMEAAAKQDFLGYMKTAVFEPLGLANTVPDVAGAVDPQRTEFYETRADGEFVVAPKVNLSFVWPAGGFLSTAEDLVRFGTAVLQPGFLKPESRRLLFLSQKTSAGQLTHYGVGWYVGRIAYHGGDSIGGTSILILDPSSRVVVAILTNRGHLAFGRENGRLKRVKLPDALVFRREKIALEIIRMFAALRPE
ncbi:MAG TPA: serine hydrolase domain-containing protein [Dongiaceae bacterium]|nr:serine hydrolase domain-containing protein [Dongiaceae bacterium]